MENSQLSINQLITGEITALFRTSFRKDFRFNPQELFVFALIGVITGLGGAGFVKFHRHIVLFFRNHPKLNHLLNIRHVLC